MMKTIMKWWWWWWEEGGGGIWVKGVWGGAGGEPCDDDDNVRGAIIQKPSFPGSSHRWQMTITSITYRWVMTYSVFLIFKKIFLTLLTYRRYWASLTSLGAWWTTTTSSTGETSSRPTRRGWTFTYRWPPWSGWWWGRRWRWRKGWLNNITKMGLVLHITWWCVAHLSFDSELK